MPRFTACMKRGYSITVCEYQESIDGVLDSVIHSVIHDSSGFITFVRGEGNYKEGHLGRFACSLIVLQQAVIDRVIEGIFSLISFALHAIAAPAMDSVKIVASILFIIKPHVCVSTTKTQTGGDLFERILKNFQKFTDPYIRRYIPTSCHL